MRNQKFINQAIAIAIVIGIGFLLAGCSVNVKKNDGGEDKKVDIETPFGGIHVSNDVDVRDTGLDVYPGARQKPKTNDGDEKSANVNISTSKFGLRVVAVEFLSDDPPEKLIKFYKDQLKKYGSVVECHTSHHHVTVNRGGDHKGGDADKPVSCDSDNNGKVVELKVGTEGNQHVVAVEPEGKGSSFALVYVRTRGDETI
jgi:hypothetical protein